MPSTYTANGGIELPANGEQSATWGSTVNDNMSILDRITNGVGSISLAGTTHTLPTTDGTLSDGQNRVLVLGGSPSGPNTITVTPNNGQHIYIIKNLSGQTATFTQGSGSNVSVLNGTTKIIYCDGGGGGAAVVDLTATFDLGSLVIGGNTVTASAAELNIMDGVTATTAEINIMDGVTATTAELNYVDGVTSPIQTQLEAKAADTTQDTATWEAGSGTEDTVVSPAKVKAAIQTNLIGDEGAVGTYAMLSASSSLAMRDAGETVSGSSLRWANAYSNNNVTPNGASSIVGYGTWRLMGNTGYENNGSLTASYQRNQTSLWLRIS